MRAPAAEDSAAAGSAGAAAARARRTSAVKAPASSAGAAAAPASRAPSSQVDGVLYVTAPDNVWAIDARDGRLLWQYFWKTKGGTHIGNRGAALWHNYLFFETPDNYLVSLDAKTGKERWHVEISDFNQQYFSTMAPIVVGNQVLVGTGNDLDAPGFLQSFDPVTGKRQVDLLHRADEAGRSRPRHVAEPRGGASRRRAGLDSRRLRSGDQAVHLRHRQSDARLHGRGPQGRQPLHLLARSRSTSTPARWPGTTRPRRTTRTTGTRRRRRS